MVASMDYRLAPDHPWPAQLEDVLEAIAFLRGQFIDPDRLAVWGHSAGGHLAMMAALSKPEWVRCAVALGAPSSLDALDEAEVRDVLVTIHWRVFHPAKWRSTTHRPCFLVHGTADNVCPIEQARSHAQSRSGVEPLEVLDGDHGIRWPPIAALRRVDKRCLG